MSEQATILYPNNTLQIPLNVKDSINVVYHTTWPSVNLTLLCRSATSRTYAFYNAPDNPLPSNGTYLTTNINDMNFDLTAYPGDCVFRLTKYGSNSINNDGGAFTLTSSDAAPRTFAISSTVGLVATTTAASTLATITTSTSTQTPTSSPSSSPQPTQPNKSTSLAIGVIVALGVFIVIAAVYAWTRFMRKRMLINQNQRHHPTTTTDDTVYQPYRKAELHSESSLSLSPSPMQPYRGQHYYHDMSPLDSRIGIAVSEKDGHGLYFAEKDGSLASLPRLEMPASIAAERRNPVRYELA